MSRLLRVSLLAALSFVMTGCPDPQPTPPDASSAAVCGNAKIEGTEACDGTALNGKTCVTEGFESGTLTCKSDCTFDTSACVAADDCGNGDIDGTEACDGSNLNNKTCETEGFTGGTLACKSDCTLDTAGCTNANPCGNGNIDTGEACDGANLNSKTCVTEGFGDGTLACKSDCTFDFTACGAPATCGDGDIDAAEQCDGDDLNSKTCQTEGFDSGTLSCNTNCTLNTSACVMADPCGNGDIDAGEECDGANLDSKTCETEGFESGTLSCNADCTLNTSACVGGVTCTIDEAITAPVTITGDVSVGQYDNLYMEGLLPSTDGTLDAIVLDLYPGYGVFAGGLMTGTFDLTGDELSLVDCGLCLSLYSNVDVSANTYEAFYMPTSGTVEISSIQGSLVAKLTEGNFQHVDVDTTTGATTPNADGCTTTLSEVNWDGEMAQTCDPLNPVECQAGEGCYATADGNTCGPEGTLDLGETCDGTVNCKPGLDCFGPSGGPYTCMAYCSVASPTACQESEQCYGLEQDLGVCIPCPAESVCGSACCGASQYCDEATTSCMDIVTCDPLAPTACDAATQGCYWTGEGYECRPKGAGVIGTPCEADAECEPGLGCWIAATGISYQCTPYCDPAGSGVCTADQTCDDPGDGNGLCVDPPAQACDLWDSASCTTAGEACYPASNGATNCLPAGTLPVGDDTCEAIADCVPGSVCMSNGWWGTCTAICDPVGTPNHCPNVTDTCSALGDLPFGECVECDSAKVCGDACCSETEQCNATSNTCEAIPVPDNDGCGTDGANAIPLTLNAAPVSGNTATAANDYGTGMSQTCDVDQSGPSSAPGPDVVYVYTPAADGDFLVKLVQDFDAVLWVTADVCGDAAQCAYVRDTLGNETVLVAGVANTKYYIHVDGYTASALGAFTIQVVTSCDPLAPTACDAATEGCYYDGSAFVCAPVGSIAIGSDCTDLGSCVAGAECIEEVCHQFCDPDPSGTVTCSGTDRCESVTSDDSLGACFACPAEKLCGSVCCGNTEECDATTTTCVAIPTCDVFDQTSCSVAGEGCYMDTTLEAGQCVSAGSSPEGGACSTNADCAPGLGCYGGWYDECSPWCDPALEGADCPAAMPNCEEITPTVGGCW